jgi:starch-binding outer membrane protein, SusD/RagB family
MLYKIIWYTVIKRNLPLFIFITCGSIFFLAGCKKFITVDPPITFTNTEVVYKNDPTAIAAVTGLYTAMSNENFNGGLGFTLMSFYPGLSADEYTLFGSTSATEYVGYYKNKLDPVQNSSSNFWSPMYSTIYVVNSAINGLTKSTSLTAPVRQQLLGESYFMRAFAYFYLVNLYGDVPLILSTDFEVNSKMSRTSMVEVYAQIIKDLQQAQNLMVDNYLDGSLLKTTENRIRPNKSAATALLARVYLYNENWIAAESESTKIIENVSLYDTVPINKAFLKNSKETIWALQVTNSGNLANTPEARVFIIPESGLTVSNNPIFLNEQLVGSFEISDKRKSGWINFTEWNSNIYYYPFKYKVGNVEAENIENPIVLRLAEQYLIRSEARAQQNLITGLAGAQSDLNIIRSRAGLPESITSDKESILNEILKERRHELFSEWGHRWLDLKRTKTIDEVMPSAAALKNGIWDSRAQFYPIPQEDIIRGINLVQNPGYN